MSSLSGIWLGDYTEQISARILEYDKDRARAIPPRVAGGSEAQQPFGLCLLIWRIEIEVNPAATAGSAIAALKRQIGTPF